VNPDANNLSSAGANTDGRMPARGLNDRKYAVEFFDAPGPTLSQCGHEPSLREIIYSYYAPVFSTERAEELAQEYIDAVAAAAPDLLAPLKAILRTGVEDYTCDPDLRAALIAARAAIAKAEASNG